MDLWFIVYLVDRFREGGKDELDLIYFMRLGIVFSSGK